MTHTPRTVRLRSGFFVNPINGENESTFADYVLLADYDELRRAHADALEELARMKAPVDGEIAEVVRKLRDWKQVRTKPMPLAHYFAAGCEAADILESLAAKVAELETELLGVKEYREKNPLGGPAKVFDAMADQIRAGDDFNKVIADYGWCQVARAERAESALAESERRLAFRGRVTNGVFCDGCADWEQMAWESERKCERLKQLWFGDAAPSETEYAAEFKEDKP